MASLTKCLQQMGLSKYEADILRGTTADYREDGMEANAAAQEAVKDYIAQLEKERAQLVEQIMEKAKAAGVEKEVAAALEETRPTEPAAPVAEGSPAPSQEDAGASEAAAEKPEERAEAVAARPEAAEAHPSAYDEKAAVRKASLVAQMGKLRKQKALNAAAVSATNPDNSLPETTEAQEAVGNHRKEKVSIDGLEIVIEKPRGSVRSGVDRDGKQWRVRMTDHYGYVRGSQARDGDQVDVYLRSGSDPTTKPVYVIDQRDLATKRYDETKAVLGAHTPAEAAALYDRHFRDAKGPQRRSAIVEMSFQEFKDWLASGRTRAPIAGQGVGRDVTSVAAVMKPQNQLAVEMMRLKAAREGTLAATGVVMTPAYTGAGRQGENPRGARPDAIRQAIRDLFRVPINEKMHVKSRDILGLYRIKPMTIRIRNQNDIGVISHELGHHFSNTSREIRNARKAFDAELTNITPYAHGQKTTALQREEGFAEFIRFYLTIPAQARARAPRFSVEFENYIRKDKRAQAAFAAVQSAIADWQALPPAERILAKVGTFEPGFPGKVKEATNLDRFIFQVLDRWLPLKRMVEDLAPGIEASRDPFKLAHLLAGDAAIVEDWLTRGTVPFDFTRRASVTDRGKPLAEILKPVANDFDRFKAYLIAKRADELHARDKEHLLTPDEIREGLKLETPAIKAAAEDLYAYNDQLLDYAVEGGLLSDAAAEKFRALNLFYVPFFREGAGTGGRGANIFKAIRGGTGNLNDPIANVIENTARIIYATNRNHVLIRARALARQVPGGGRWLEEVPIPEVAVKLATKRIIGQLREQGVMVDESTAQQLAQMQTFFVKNPMGDEAERTIVLKVAGEPKAVQVNSPLLWEALKRFEPADLGIVTEILAVPAQLLRTGVVLSPEFMARNFMRDTFSGFMQSKAGILPVAGTLQGFKEIATRGDAAQLYRAFGGAYADMWKGDSTRTRKVVERMASRGRFPAWSILTPAGILDVLERIGSFSEAGTRVGEFRKTMTQDGADADTLIEAAFRAREVSVDFGQHGAAESVRLLTRITPFLNPAMQGLYKMGRTSREKFFLTLLRGSVLTAASVALYLMNFDEDWYDEIEAWERNAYWHFDVGLRTDKGEVVPLRVPKPFEWGALFGSVPEALTATATKAGDEKLGERLAGILTQSFGLRLIPTAALVPAELWANKSTFTDRPIVPGAKARLPAELQANPETSLTARELGKLTGASPAKIDHAVRGFFGTLGTYAVMLADQAVRMAGYHPPAPEWSWRRMPVVKAFVHDPDNPNSRHVTEFYKLLDAARKARAAERMLREAGDEEAAENPLASRASALQRVARKLASINRDMEAVRESRDLTPRQKRLQLAELALERKEVARIGHRIARDAQP